MWSLGNSQQVEPWLEIAEAVHLLVARPGVLGFFRQQVREAAGERLMAFDQKSARAELRRNALKQAGTWRGRQKLPTQPAVGWFHWVETFRGAVKLPGSLKTADGSKRQLKAFRYIKSKGFPNDLDGIEYSWDVEAWLQPELSPDNDPDDTPPLPVPGRPVSLLEKFAGLAAVYDAHWRGMETIGPCSDDLADRESNWYALLVQAAKDLDPTDAVVVRSWLVEVEAEIGKLKAGASPKKGKRGPKGPRCNSTEDAKIYRRWELFKAGGRAKIDDFARKQQGAENRLEIKAVRDAIERHRKRLGRKGQK